MIPGQLSRLGLVVALVLSVAHDGSFVILPMVASAAPQAAGLHTPTHGSEAHEAGHDHYEHSAMSWEGSPAGKAYSEFNHHLAGLFVIVIGLAELVPALGAVKPGRNGPVRKIGAGLRRMKGMRWTSFLLPGSMLLTGLFLLIWSDHEGWPIGQRSLIDTYFGNDLEMIQHKLFGIMLLTVGTVETLRRLGRLEHTGWRVPLPGLAIIGGLALFLHSHGVHPAAHKIALHHAVMGAMAVTAGTSKVASIWPRVSAPGRWEQLWGVLVVLIGLQLLIYSE